MGPIKWLKTKDYLNCYSLARRDGSVNPVFQVFFDGWMSAALTGQDCEYVFTP